MPYKHFTLSERKYLQELLDDGYSMRKAARALGRSPSSVSRELKRNKTGSAYSHFKAHRMAKSRKVLSHPLKRLLDGAELGLFVREKLSLFWPPETIAAIWNLNHPDDHVGFSTIYRWLQRDLLIGFSRKLHLRRRGKRIQTRNANYNAIHPDRLIRDWPDAIVQRSRIGDWEGDTVCGGKGKGAIVTLVDRKSRFLCSYKVPSLHQDEIQKAILIALKGKPVLSISLDNGSEFSRFREMEKKLKAPFFFADLHAPWQRGSNENMNDLLRFFFPKGYDFRAVSRPYLQFVVSLLNSRPRKCLGWKTPEEVFFSSLSVALP